MLGEMTDWDGFVYILKVPLEITNIELTDGSVSDPGTFHVVQVGMVSRSDKPGSTSWQALSRRLYQHMFAWTRVTSTMMNGGYPRNPSDAESTESLEDINIRSANFPYLIGLLPRRFSEGDDNRIQDTEIFVRELVGTKLRRKPLKQLLSQNYPPAAGRQMWEGEPFYY